MTNATAAGLVVAVTVFGYAVLVVSWAWYRWHHPYHDPDETAARRRLRRELDRYTDRGNP